MYGVHVYVELELTLALAAIPARAMFGLEIEPQWTSLLAIITVFVVSGLMHELMYYYVTRVAPTWEMTWFFILHGVAVAAEVVVKKVVPEKMRLHSVVSGALAMGFLAVTAIWLLLPPLMRNDVDEKAIGEYCKLMDLLK
ncbi:hypothetical protein Gotur_035151, partial [Gossypium turneri]